MIFRPSDRERYRSEDYYLRTPGYKFISSHFRIIFIFTAKCISPYRVFDVLYGVGISAFLPLGGERGLHTSLCVREEFLNSRFSPTVANLHSVTLHSDRCRFLGFTSFYLYFREYGANKGNRRLVYI